MKTKDDIKRECSEMYNALYEQLDSEGFVTNHYVSLIKDYVRYHEIKERLITDIETRGVVVEYGNNLKRNDSLQELPKIQKAMSGILMELGLRPSQLKGNDKGIDI